MLVWCWGWGFGAIYYSSYFCIKNFLWLKKCSNLTSILPPLPNTTLNYVLHRSYSYAVFVNPCLLLLYDLYETGIFKKVWVGLEHCRALQLLRSLLNGRYSSGSSCQYLQHPWSKNPVLFIVWPAILKFTQMCFPSIFTPAHGHTRTHTPKHTHIHRSPWEPNARPPDSKDVAWFHSQL